MDSLIPPNFITLDVEIISDENLSPLADHFEEPAFVLGNQKIDNLYHLSLEPCWFNEEDKTPENCANFFVEQISKLPIELRDLWNRANSRTFDFGFESGNTLPYYKSEISADTLLKIATIGASFAITIYQVSPSEDGRDQTQECI
ncbi:hypothetical protein H8K52_02425 [Undibacterium seohonense]|jgi:hypothetical protein|uniref:DUF4279 domain-containing protein n=1 Tax=Undibacterium seohonense TaxID=1344950 RepID=A0ABR6X0U4_9BURK|nr:hypothetical protein [Undibacterium seohonense]MBC3806200.1 hypothetical protein [Undibacterium seohonense]